MCRPCNNFTGAEYGHEYKEWVFGAWTLIHQLPGKLDLGDDPEKVGEALARLDQVDGWAEFEVEFRDVDAGRFVREALAMMCSVAGPWALTDRHPEIRKIILDGEALPLPEPLYLSHLLLRG